MSIFSDHKCGALSDEEFECECTRMNNQDRAERDEEFEKLYQEDDDSEGGLIDEED